jgi:hypothetical protein
MTGKQEGKKERWRKKGTGWGRSKEGVKNL